LQRLDAVLLVLKLPECVELRVCIRNQVVGLGAEAIVQLPGLVAELLQRGNRVL
jgi:hypothetical protein